MWMMAMISVAILVGLDQAAKLLAVSQLKPVGNIQVIKGFLDFTFVENRGAAFGILSGQRVFFIILTLVTAVVIVYVLIKLPKNREYRLVCVSLLLILSGAFGNVIDRIFRGYVVDFFEFTFISYPVFNIADIYVVVGTILLGYLLLFVIKEEPSKKEES